MGNIKKILLNEAVPKPPFNDRLTVELCENVHIHYRNIRLEFPKDEFIQLLRELKQIDEQTVEEFEYGEDKFLSLINKRMLPGISEFDDRLQIEEQVEGHYHIHYRNLRLELLRLEELGYGLFDSAEIDPDWAQGVNFELIGTQTHRLSELMFWLHEDNPTKGRWRPLDESPVLEYLNGNKKEYTDYLELVRRIHEKHASHSVERLEALRRSIDNKGYKSCSIATLDDRPLIADGHHRASILYHRFGDMEIRTTGVRLT